jgi:hypothetical protein
LSLFDPGWERPGRRSRKPPDHRGPSPEQTIHDYDRRSRTELAPLSQGRLPHFGQAGKQPVRHRRRDMRVASLNRPVRVTHLRVHEHRWRTELLHQCTVGVPQPVRSQAGGDGHPAGVGSAGRVAAPDRWAERVPRERRDYGGPTDGAPPGRTS